MKKYAFALVLTLIALPLLSACGKKVNYEAYLSEVRSDIFIAADDDFTVEISCVSREYPYHSDGIAAPMSDLIEISLKAKTGDYTVSLTGGEKIGGDTSFRNTRGDYFFSQGVKSFPKESVTLLIEWEGGSREMTATSVKNEHTLTVERALACAVKAEKETLDGMYLQKTFCGEFYVRLLRRDKNYYYVGITDTQGRTLSLLLDSETGDVLARRAP